MAWWSAPGRSPRPHEGLDADQAAQHLGAEEAVGAGQPDQFGAGRVAAGGLAAAGEALEEGAVQGEGEEGGVVEAAGCRLGLGGGLLGAAAPGFAGAAGRVGGAGQGSLGEGVAA